MTRYVIVGSGIAGLSAAEVLRVRDPTASIVMVGEEAHVPYSRPGLAYLLAGVIPERQLTVRSKEEIDRLQLDRRADEVVRLDPSSHTVVLGGGEVLSFDKLLLATGAQALALDVPGGDLDGVVRLDHLGHARDILRRARRAKSAVVVGGGPTAVELAEGLRAQGLCVHYLLRGERYWSSVLDSVESEMVEAALVHDGILLHRRTKLARALGRNGRLTGVETDVGEVIACDLLAVAIGVAPRVGLAQAAGLAVGRGILVDAAMRTSAADVFAAGDAAEVRDPNTGATALEGLWSSALAQGRAAGRSMAGSSMHYRPEPALNVTRLGGITVAIIGTVAPPDSRMPDPDLQTFARGDSERWRTRGDGGAVRMRGKGTRIRVTVRADRVVGAVVMGDATASRALCQLVRSRVVIPNLQALVAGDPGEAIEALLRLGEAERSPDAEGIHADGS